MKVFLRILKEFWFPSVFAIAWTAYNLHASPRPWGALAIVNIFGPSFFLASWATGQIFRVKNRHEVKSSFEKLQDRLEAAIEKLEVQSTEIEGFVKGTLGRCTIEPTFDFFGDVVIVVANESAYPVFDVVISAMDLDGPPVKGKSPFALAHGTVGAVYPGGRHRSDIKYPLVEGGSIRLTVWIRTRYSNEVFDIRVSGAKNRLIAIAERTEQGTVYRIPDQFPEYDKERPEKIFELDPWEGAPH